MSNDSSQLYWSVRTSFQKKPTTIMNRAAGPAIASRIGRTREGRLADPRPIIGSAAYIKIAVSWLYHIRDGVRFKTNCMAAQGDVTGLLLKWSKGDEQALDALMPLVYGELKRLADIYLHRERSEHTLQST